MNSWLMLKWPNKDPQDVLDYGIGGWLVHIGGGDRVQSAEWIVEPAGELTVADHAVSEDGDDTLVWLSGGAPGQTYTVTCRATTLHGRKIERSARIFVTER